ncbi:MAG: hypothetical protein R6X32_01845, partial [Chloroflexota bacterium]
MATFNRFNTTESQRIYSPWDKVGLAIWAILFGLAVSLFALAFYDQMRLLSQPRQAGLPGDDAQSILQWYLLLLNLVSALAFASVSAVLAWRRYNNWMALVTAVMLVTIGLSLVNPITYVLWDTRPALSLPLHLLGAVGGLSFAYFLYAFPQGSFSSKRVAVVGTIAMIWFALTNGLLAMTGLINIDELYSTFALPLTIVSFILYGSPMVIRPELRRKEHSETQQQQVKLIGSGLSIALAGYVISVLRFAILPYLTTDTVTIVLVNIIASLLGTVAITAVPITIGMAIMRYRLWDVDFFINRSLVYGVLTVSLAVLTVLELLLFQWLLRLITGQEQVTVALIIAAMVSGWLFRPTQRWLQRFVDQRLYGVQIPYGKVKKEDKQKEGTAVASLNQQKL